VALETAAAGDTGDRRQPAIPDAERGEVALDGDRFQGFHVGEGTARSSTRQRRTGDACIAIRLRLALRLDAWSGHA
jgi:hypothetical protein